MGKSFRTFSMAITFLIAAPHFSAYGLHHFIFHCFITEFVNNRTDIRFDDEELRPSFTKAAAHEIKQFILIDLAGTRCMIADNIIFLTQKKGNRNGMDMGAKQQANV